MFKTLAVIGVLISAVSSAQAAPSKQIATGEQARQMWIQMKTSSVHRDPLGKSGTQFKVVNLTTKGAWSIQRGEHGVVCELFSDKELIKEVGSNYACTLVDLRN
jgi:hypothetical protein